MTRKGNVYLAHLDALTGRLVSEACAAAGSQVALAQRIGRRLAVLHSREGAGPAASGPERVVWAHGDLSADNIIVGPDDDVSL